MEENKSIFNYAGQVFSTYGIIVMIFVFAGLILGDKASEYSTLYSYGSDGFSNSILLQLFVLSLIITVAQIVFFTDRLIKDMKLFLRILFFIGIIIVTIVLFVILFKWFPVNDSRGWICFFISFTICTAVSIIVTRYKETAENKRMEQALNKFNQGK